MTWFGRLFGGLAKAARAAVGGMRFPSFGTHYWREGLRDERNYNRLVGDGSGNSIVSACVLWIARTFPEAPPALWQGDDAGVRNRISRHPLIKLLRYPTSSPENPGGYYSGALLWMATLTSWVLDGNAYWFKVRSPLGRVVQLWFVPHWMMEPVWPTDGSAYLSHYEYRLDGRIIPVPPSEIVHFRHGLDLDNTRKGRSPLSAVLREVYTDEEAARFTASILKNLGMPGVVISPGPAGAGGPWRPNPDDVKAIKADFKDKYTGDHRGDPLVMSGPTQIATFGFSPTEMTLRDLRNIPEERITAVLGIPAAVVGFGAGLQYTKVGATFAGFRDQAWQSNLIPTQRILSAEIQTQLLPDFTSDLEGMEFGFDISKVKVLQEDQGKMAERWARLVSAGIAKRSEARNAFDLVSGPEDDIYLPQPGVQGGSADSSSSTADLEAQIADLQSQLDAEQPSKSEVPEAMEALIQGIQQLPEALVSAVKQSPAPNITINPPRVVIAEGAIKSHVDVHLPAPATKKRTKMTKPDGSVVVIESEDV